MTDRPVVIIGAGPAGLGVARGLCDSGVASILLDQQSSPGGQLLRGLSTHVSDSKSRILGDGYRDRLQDLSVVDNPLVDYRPDTTVWRIDSQGHVTSSRGDKARTIVAGDVVIATGALERALPIPGWTLPGVMTVGAAQIMLKAHGIVAERAVLVGAGPLLYLLAVQMIRAGTPPVALVETQTRKDQCAALLHLPRALQGFSVIKRGLSLLREIRQAKVPRYTAATGVRIERGECNRVHFEQGRQSSVLSCDHVLLHHGVIPDTQLTRSLGLAHHWDKGQCCFVPTLSETGASSLDNVWVVGDGARIHGGEAAFKQGVVLGMQLAARRGAQIASTHAADQLSRSLRRELAVRPFLDTLYPPVNVVSDIADDTIVCRCESVTAGAIRRFAANGCLGPNQTKAFSRCGMGPCQGRYCGLTVTQMLADIHGLEPDDVGSYRIRSPIKPITLGMLATLASGEVEASGDDASVTEPYQS